MFVVMHDGTLGERAVPDGWGGVVVAEPGVAFEVHDDVAGQAPGEWEPADSDVVVDDEGRDVSGRYAHEPVPSEAGGGWLRRELGHGLLAQEDVFREADEFEVAALGADAQSGGDA